jgi:hypothetical protein
MLTTWHPLSIKVGTNFANKRRLLGQHSIVHSRTQATEFPPPSFSCHIWADEVLHSAMESYLKNNFLKSRKTSETLMFSMWCIYNTNIQVLSMVAYKTHSFTITINSCVSTPKVQDSGKLIKCVADYTMNMLFYAIFLVKLNKSPYLDIKFNLLTVSNYAQQFFSLLFEDRWTNPLMFSDASRGMEKLKQSFWQVRITWENTAL